MNYSDNISKARNCFILVFAAALLTACNTTAPVRSSGAPGAPTAPGSPVPSGSPGSSGPSVQVQAPGMPGMPGPPGLPTTGSGDAPGAPAPVTVSVPAPQPGTPAAGSGAGPTQAGSKPAGRQNKTDDEILAEALEELGKRPGQEQQGDSAAGQASRAGAADPATTAAEKKQALGEELEQGFAEFDQLMLSEQQANNERADQEGAGGFAEDDELYADSDPGQDAAGEPLQTAMVDSDTASIKGEENIPARSHSQVPPDLVDAGDDDIIARQLREAAMKEQDPELREKLWDEYRKYKRDAR